MVVVPTMSLVLRNRNLFIWRPPFGFAQGLELVERLSAKQKIPLRVLCGSAVKILFSAVINF